MSHVDGLCFWIPNFITNAIAWNMNFMDERCARELEDFVRTFAENHGSDDMKLSKACTSPVTRMRCGHAWQPAAAMHDLNSPPAAAPASAAAK